MLYTLVSIKKSPRTEFMLDIFQWVVLRTVWCLPQTLAEADNYKGSITNKEPNTDSVASVSSSCSTDSMNVMKS